MAVAPKNTFQFLIDPQGHIVDAVKLSSWIKDHDETEVPQKWALRGKPKDRYSYSPLIFDENHNYTLPKGYTVRGGTRAQRDEWIAGRDEPGYTDIVGRPLKKGARVAVAFALGRGAEQRVGRIVGFDKLLGDSYGDDDFWSKSNKIPEDEQIVVEWEESNARYGGTPDTSKIFAYLRRAVVIE